MVKSETTSITPAQHAARHVIGGEDPLIDPLFLHAARHGVGGADPTPIGHEDATEMLGGNTVSGVWTDLNLSGVVGVRQCLVFLRVTHAAAGARYFRVRRKGATDDSGNNEHGASEGVINQNQTAHLVTTTDVNGVIQYEASSIYNADVYVEAWIPI